MNERGTRACHPRNLFLARAPATGRRGTQYKAEPEYQGKSFIPIAVKITAWNPGQFTTAINIWGDALGRE
jgi:hypothetical protein